jgi:hypothetical protein
MRAKYLQYVVRLVKVTVKHGAALSATAAAVIKGSAIASRRSTTWPDATFLFDIS